MISEELIHTKRLFFEEICDYYYKIKGKCRYVPSKHGFLNIRHLEIQKKLGEHYVNLYIKCPFCNSTDLIKIKLEILELEDL